MIDTTKIILIFIIVECQLLKCHVGLYNVNTGNILTRSFASPIDNLAYEHYDTKHSSNWRNVVMLSALVGTLLGAPISQNDVLCRTQ